MGFLSFSSSKGKESGNMDGMDGLGIQGRSWCEHLVAYILRMGILDNDH